MAFAHHRTRVERLLYGGFHTDDLTRLFLSMRIETEAETVKELGHFIAHSDERFSGVTTDMTKEFFAIMRFWAPAYMPKADGVMERHYNFQNMPPDFGSYLVANFKNLNRKTVFEQTGLKQRDAIRTFERILPKFSRYANGRYHQVQYLTPPEEKLFMCLMSSMNTKPAFSTDRLYGEFTKELLRLGYLRSGETAQFKKIKPALALFAIATMHGCKVVLEDGFESRLHASEAADGLAITSVSNTPTPFIPNLRMATQMFTTNLPAKIWCGEPLRKLLQPNSHTFPIEEIAIELRDNQRLEAILPPSSFLPPGSAILPLQPRTQNSLRLYAGLSLASLSFLLSEGLQRAIARLRR